MSEETRDVTHRPPTSAFTWRLDEESFDGALVELLRGGDTVSPRMAVDEIARDMLSGRVSISRKN
jgi:hypothetical protein